MTRGDRHVRRPGTWGPSRLCWDTSVTLGVRAQIWTHLLAVSRERVGQPVLRFLSPPPRGRPSWRLLVGACLPTNVESYQNKKLQKRRGRPGSPGSTPSCVTVRVSSPLLSPCPAPAVGPVEQGSQPECMQLLVSSHRLLGSTPAMSPTSGTHLDGDATRPEGPALLPLGRQGHRTHRAFSLHSGKRQAGVMGGLQWARQAGQGEGDSGRDWGGALQEEGASWKQSRLWGQAEVAGILAALCWGARHMPVHGGCRARLPLECCSASHLGSELIWFSLFG